MLRGVAREIRQQQAEVGRFTTGADVGKNADQPFRRADAQRLDAARLTRYTERIWRIMLASLSGDRADVSTERDKGAPGGDDQRAFRDRGVGTLERIWLKRGKGGPMDAVDAAVTCRSTR